MQVAKIFEHRRVFLGTRVGCQRIVLLRYQIDLGFLDQVLPWISNLGSFQVSVLLALFEAISFECHFDQGAGTGSDHFCCWETFGKHDLIRVAALIALSHCQIHLF